MPVIPFLVPLLRRQVKEAKGQKGHLGELRAAESTKRTPRWLPTGGPVMTVPGKELEDGAAGPAIRDEAIGACVLQVDGLAARPLPLPQPPTPAAQGDGPEKFKELALPPARPRRRSGQVQMLLLPHPPRRGATDA